MVTERNSRPADMQPDESNEYEHEAVPLRSRRSLLSITTVWLGFPMIITCAMTGSLLVASMGFMNAVWAILLGNLILFVLVSAIGSIGAKTGMNFALLASNVFGKRGYVTASGLLSLLILGWFAVQVGFTGNLLKAAFGYNYFLVSLVAGVLYLAVTLIGIRGLHWIGLISAPLFLVVGIWASIHSIVHSDFHAILTYAGSYKEMPMAFGIALTMVVGLFIDGAIVSPDFNRWARSSRDSTIAAFITFPLAHTFALLTGGIITAALANPSPDPFGLDNIFGYVLKNSWPWLSPLAVVFAFLSFGSVCSHNLYMSSVNWSRIAGIKMRTAATFLALIGITVAAGNIWSYFVPWLNLLGILVPPVGAIFLVHFHFLSTDPFNHSQWRPTAFWAWGLGSLTAYLIDHFMPQMSTSISSFIAAGLAYWVIENIRVRQTVVTE